MQQQRACFGEHAALPPPAPVKDRRELSWTSLSVSGLDPAAESDVDIEKKQILSLTPGDLIDIGIS